jgi:hypothetical protein
MASSLYPCQKLYHKAYIDPYIMPGIIKINGGTWLKRTNAVILNILRTICLFKADKRIHHFWYLFNATMGLLRTAQLVIVKSLYNDQTT